MKNNKALDEQIKITITNQTNNEQEEYPKKIEGFLSELINSHTRKHTEH